jgi:hypothetical protein
MLVTRASDMRVLCAFDHSSTPATLACARNCVQHDARRSLRSPPRQAYLLLPAARMSGAAAGAAARADGDAPADDAAAAPPPNGSLAGFDNLDSMLAAYLPPAQLREARRVLYGAQRATRRVLSAERVALLRLRARAPAADVLRARRAERRRGGAAHAAGGGGPGGGAGGRLRLARRERA